eukprot:3089792-Rhodomonas_salina.3
MHCELWFDQWESVPGRAPLFFKSDQVTCATWEVAARRALIVATPQAFAHVERMMLHWIRSPFPRV